MKHERACFVKQFIATHSHKQTGYPYPTPVIPTTQHPNIPTFLGSQAEIHCRKLVKWQNNETKKGLVVPFKAGACPTEAPSNTPGQLSSVYYNSQHMNLVLNLNANCVCMQSV